MNSLENSPTQSPETKGHASPIAALGQEDGKRPVKLRRIGSIVGHALAVH